MFIGGMRALLLQTLHPAAMRAVSEHSGYRGDMWGRLHRTSRFLAVTTFGHEEDAQQAVDVVRSIHERVVGTMPDGSPYAASDPDLLRWVHVAEVDSFLRAHDVYGARPLDPEQRDEYLRQAAVVATRLGATDVPTDAAALRECLAAYRPVLRGTPEAREAVRHVLLAPPLPVFARPPYGVLAAAAVGLMPAWTRPPLAPALAAGLRADRRPGARRCGHQHHPMGDDPLGISGDLGLDGQMEPAHPDSPVHSLATRP